MVNISEDENRISVCQDLDFLRGTEGKEPIGFSDSYMLFYFEKAFGTAIIDGCEYTLYDNCAVLLPPLCFYRFNFAGEPLGRILSFFDSDILPMVRGHFDNLFSDGKAVLPRPAVLHGVSDALGKTLLRIFELTRDNSLNGLYFKMLISEAVLLSEGVRVAPIFDDTLPLSLRVFEYLNENYDAPFSLDRVAKRFFKSKFHLSRAFLSFIGLTPHKFITLKRLCKARILINDGIPRQDAARAVGYNNYSVFYRAYKKHYGGI